MAFGSNPRERLPRLALCCWNCPPQSYLYRTVSPGLGLALVWSDLCSSLKPSNKAGQAASSLRHLKYLGVLYSILILVSPPKKTVFLVQVGGNSHKAEEGHQASTSN